MVHPVRIVATFLIWLLWVRHYSNTFHIWSHLIVTITLQTRHYHYPKITHENTETQRGELTSQLTLYNYEMVEIQTVAVRLKEIGSTKICNQGPPRRLKPYQLF